MSEESNQLKTEAWRVLGPEVRDEYIEWLSKFCKDKFDKGMEEHGVVFTEPDPLRSALEEAADLIFYLWLHFRRMEQEEELKDLVSKLNDVNNKIDRIQKEQEG